MKKLVDLLASYALACLLLACIFVLTIFGTLYQVDHGLYEAKEVFFSSWFLWAGPVPYFPGGMLCMGLLALNMLVGGFIRMKVSKRNAGVLVIHTGVALLLFAGLVKVATADEGKLRLFEGDQANYFDSFYLWEVAIWDLDAGTEARELVIPDEFFSDLGEGETRTFTSPELPFDLELSNFLNDCRVLEEDTALMSFGANWRKASPVVDGFALFDLGADSRDEGYYGGVTVRAKLDSGETHENFLFGVSFAPWTLEAGGKRWAIDLRNERYAMPFWIQLEDFQKEEHPGTSMARAYRSWVQKVEPDNTERVLIEMNEPLRSDNLILFQSSYGEFGGRDYSVFSVVRNVSDRWPEISMWVITLGMLMTFGVRLVKFTERQNQLRKEREAKRTSDGGDQ